MRGFNGVDVSASLLSLILQLIFIARNSSGEFVNKHKQVMCRETAKIMQILDILR
jgi:hypothetical protein